MQLQAYLELVFQLRGLHKSVGMNLIYIVLKSEESIIARVLCRLYHMCAEAA